MDLQRNSSLALGCALLSFACQSGTPSELEPEGVAATAAERLLDRSIAFHDPEGAWGSRAIAIDWTGTRPDGRVSLAFHLEFGPGSAFSMQGEYGGSSIDYQAADGAWSATVDGETELTDEMREKAGLVREDGFFWGNYFGFLGGMPMCLRDANVQLSSAPLKAEFEGREVQTIQASFAAEVGTDTWTFYFDPETARVLGCRFDRADPERDGETLVFEELVSLEGVRLPKRRLWFMNEDRAFLGTDELAVAN